MRAKPFSSNGGLLSFRTFFLFPSALRNPQENDNKKNLLTHVYCVTRGVPDFSFLRTVVSMAAAGTVRCVRSEKSRLEPVLPFGQETMHQPCAFYIQPPLSADFFEPASQPPSHALFSLLSTLSPQPLNRCCHLCRHHHHQYQTTITSAACLILFISLPFLLFPLSFAFGCWICSKAQLTPTCTESQLNIS